MSTAASGESVLSGVQPVRGCSWGSLGVGGLAAAVQDRQRHPSPTDMGVLCSIPFSTCSWLPWGVSSAQIPGPAEGHGLLSAQPDLSPGEGMEQQAGRCWAGSSLGLGVAGHRATRAIQPHTRGQHPHSMTQGSSAVSGDRGVTPVPAGWDHHQPGCVSSLGTAHGVVVTFIAQIHPGVVSCPPLCQPGQVPKPLEGIVRSIW